MMKQKGLLFLIIFTALLAGGLAAFGYSQATSSTEIVVANEEITMDTKVNAESLRVMEVPKSFAEQTGALTQIDQAVGQYLAVSVVPGQPITQNMISTAQNLQSLLNQYIEKTGEQGVLMQLPATTVLAGHVRPGQNVALLINAQQGNNASVPPTLVAPIHVLAVDMPPEDSNGTNTLLVVVRNEQFETVSRSITANQAHVVMYPNDGSLPANGVQDPKQDPKGDAGDEKKEEEARR